jgi:thiol-disulfide isomerase/thioredoxin
MSPSKPAPTANSNPVPQDIPEIPRLTPGTSASVGKGLLAGLVIDKFDRKVPKASIQLVEVRDGGPTGAPVEFSANEQGYFTIPGLDAQQTYQLIVRKAEGTKVVMAATVFARAPDPRLLIKISEDYVTPSVPTPPPLPAVTVPPLPGKAKEPKESEEKKEPAKPEQKPAATLGEPKPTKPEEPPPPPDSTHGAEASVPDAGSVRTPRPDLRIRVPPSLVVPPVPLHIDPAGSENPYSSQRLPVPSCIMLTSKQIDNFALQQPDGTSWEFRRNHKGRLILLDFWHTACPPCLRAISHLNELNQMYSARGLEVIGVACEQGPFDQRVQRVGSVRGRYDIRYRILMNGDQGALKPCPLCTQLGIAMYPTLKLITDRGEVVWESVGLSDRQLYELKREIERRLPLTR